MIKGSALHKLIYLLETSYKSLGIPLSTKKLEDIAILVHEGMSGRDRRYHRVRHILDICKGAEPIETLAIIFHDIIYIQVDKRLHSQLKPYLKEFVIQDSSRVCLPAIHRTSPLPELFNDPWLELAYAIFGFEGGQEITLKDGINEFLSAMVAARILENALNYWQVAQIICAIEETIPFRPKSPEILAERLEKLVAKNGLDISETEIRKTVQHAVAVANRDVSGFAGTDPGLFMSQTWQLVLENHPMFRSQLYPISHYRTALHELEHFHISLKPQHIFRQYKGAPTQKVYDRLIERATVNETLQLQYIRTNLVTVGIIEAVAGLTGGDAPYILFIGNGMQEIESSIKTTHALASQYPKVLSLLKFGKVKNSSHELVRSPIASFIYQNSTEKDFADYLEYSNLFFQKKLTAEEYLLKFPKKLLLPVLEFLKSTVATRRVELEQLMTRLF